MGTLKSWNILIADDDKKIHGIKENKYFKENLLGKSINFITAETKEKAFKILKEKHNEIAVILYDIALANENDLEVIDFIRNVLKNERLQIIIRSDKSINFSQREITDNYVIHDYIDDDDNTDGTLIFTVKSAISTYNDIQKIDEQNKIIAEQKKVLEDSIDAASYVQKALFSKKEILKEYFPDSFIIHRPLHDVGGDFYYFNKILGKYIIISADCTGHGVPAALTSMLGLSFLKRIIETDKVFDPANILTKLDNEILKIFKNKEAEGTAPDGMDISVCTIDLKNKILLVSGAKNIIIHINKEKGLIKYKGSNYSIGGKYDTTYEKNFKTKYIPIQKDDIIYMFSDGYYSQAGVGDEPLKKKGFYKILREINKESMNTQKQILLEKLTNRINENEYNEQTDDILVIGIKIP